MADAFLRKRHGKASEKELNNYELIKRKAVLNVEDNNILFGLIIFRVCNVFLVQTWFVPDEFWQGPEVAHKMAYGYGHLTWEWREGIRGYVYPLLFGFAYKFLQILNLDYSIFVIYLPRVIQAVFGAFGEYHVYKLAGLLHGTSVAWWVLFCQVTSWFMFYCITRTLTNSMETALISIGLYYWELSQNGKTTYTTVETMKEQSDTYKALILASFSCLVRPTALVIWLPLGLARLQKSPINFFLIFIFPIGLFSLIFSIVVDSYFYGKFMFVQYNFLSFNVMQNVGQIYGTHPWHWYLTQGIPVVFLSHLVPLVVGVNYFGRSLYKWLLLIVVDITVFSLLSHKEFRFILPIIPIAMCICGKGMYHVARSTANAKKNEENSQNSKTISFKGKLLAVFLIVTNVPVALYTGLVHQRGALDVMRDLEGKVNGRSSLLFLMPCHSTPYYSYVHKNIKMRFLDCSPSKQPGYVDEAERFYNNPQKWLNETFIKKKEKLPTHLVFFDVLLKNIKYFTEENLYVECGRHFYSHFPSGRLGQSVLLFCQTE